MKLKCLICTLVTRRGGGRTFFDENCFASWNKEWGGGGRRERKRDRVIPSQNKYREKSVQRIPLSLLINLVNVFASGFLAFLYYIACLYNCAYNNERYSITYSLERDEVRKFPLNSSCEKFKKNLKFIIRNNKYRVNLHY